MRSRQPCRVFLWARRLYSGRGQCWSRSTLGGARAWLIASRCLAWCRGVLFPVYVGSLQQLAVSRWLREFGPGLFGFRNFWRSSQALFHRRARRRGRHWTMSRRSLAFLRCSDAWAEITEFGARFKRRLTLPLLIKDRPSRPEEVFPRLRQAFTPRKLAKRSLYLKASWEHTCWKNLPLEIRSFHCPAGWPWLIHLLTRAGYELHLCKSLTKFEYELKKEMSLLLKLKPMETFYANIAILGDCLELFLARIIELPGEHTKESRPVEDVREERSFIHESMLS